MGKRKCIVILGAGGFAREVRWLIEEINAVEPQFDFVGYVVSDTGKLGEQDSRDEVAGDVAWLADQQQSVQAAAIGIGTPGARLRLSSELIGTCPWLAWPSLVHPTVRLDRGSCHVGHGVLLCAGTVATVNVRFEGFSMVNLCCTIGHEATIGRGAVLNPTVNISGGVEVGEGALVGTGAQVLQYLKVGAGATVGAGAVVTKNVPAGITVVGMPAKALQKTT